MRKIVNYIKSISNKNKLIVISVIMLFLFVIFLGRSFAQLTPVKSVSIFSENSLYENEEASSFKITKSAKWISRGKAEITLKVDSQIMPNNEYTDIILILDTSGSMNENRLNQVKNDTIELINYAIPKESNVALVTFNDTSEIISEFTNDITVLEDSINSLTAFGNTNYYQALVNVDNILKNYTFEKNRDCVVLFLTDGLPNIDSPNEISQYEYLKSTYPLLVINAIQYEMGSEPVTVLKQISDYQYVADSDTLNKFLYRAAVNPVPYENFEITDYIESEYFNVSDVSSIEVTSGTVSLDENKVSWSLDNLKTGLEEKMIITVDLKEKLIGVGGVYPTNNKLEIKSSVGGYIEDISSTLTPILSDNYKIIYDSNAPNDCNVIDLPDSINASVFDIVTFAADNPSCEGYKFKNWELISDNVTKVNANYFVMPEEDVIVRATWSKLSTSKSMDGKVSKVQNLYEMMANNSVPDNVSSEFVTNSTGINFGSPSSDTNGKGIYRAVKLEGDNTPIYYYRGNIDNNNLIFANFCWKIVRTTETKGIKLLYNGVPNEEGDCVTSSSIIGNSVFNSKKDSIAYNGYMYGYVYDSSNLQTKRMDIVGFSDKTEIYTGVFSSSNYIYSSDIVYDSSLGVYTLVDGENRLWSDTYSIGNGNQYLYTCLSETDYQCETVSFITQSRSSSFGYYINFSNGENAADFLNKEIVYGNDVVYNSETGLYTLNNIFTSTVIDWKNDYTTVASGYHYTCFDESSSCSTVKYINYVDSVAARSYSNVYYFDFELGQTIDEIVNSMSSNSIHTTDSVVKTKIDLWYKENLFNYTYILEDTAWCNDLTIGTVAGWGKDGSAMEYPYYKVVNDLNNEKPSLVCRNKTDAYTVNDKISGNGDLKYSVSMLSADEVFYAGGRWWQNYKYYLNSGENWMTLSPSYFYYNYGYVANYWAVSNDGGLYSSYDVTDSMGIRPSISLKYGARSIDGDGTAEDPFIVEVDDNATISFIVNGDTYYASEGMTWYEWTTSAYEAGGVSTSYDSGSLVYDEYGHVFPDITSDSVIIAGEEYSTK